ncbi:exopolyphosphatase [Malassezia japonica]|uniref:Exopolyphosphatase n=1 Tax=Malassezia japonica TaxID=223818 RepID=A0AAF0F150_9BASI|nr:exopolyphosphatase [Malassezia japonica]WFD40848.1 exopolyphosphatase [Malassezia japonica]
MAAAPLAAFLRTRKNLAAHGAQYWVTGNEAGDLDSLACAIGYAFFSQYVNPSGSQWIPVVQTRRPDLKLRPENLLMLDKIGVDPELLVCLDEVPELGKDEHVALVDHNKATGVFAKATTDAIIDHHADEKLHTEADVRVILAPQNAGSCASVLTQYFQPLLPKSPAVPPAVADLLLSAILIDTHNMSESAGKAKAVDEGARAFLAPRSSYNSAEAQKSLYEALSDAKSDVSQLTTEQKLRRDYKFFACAAKDGGEWNIGTSSTVEPIDALLKDGPKALHNDLAAFCASKSLDLAVVLAGYTDSQEEAHRELLLYAPGSGRAVAEALAAYKEQSVDLAPLSLDLAGPYCATFTQKDPRVTRKQFAPALQAVCAATPK